MPARSSAVDTGERLGEPPSDEVITVNLEVRGPTVRLSAQSATVDAETLASLAFEVPRGEGAAAALTVGLARWKARYPKAAALLHVDDVLVDSMRGRSSTWTRIRVNLRHVPVALRPNCRTRRRE